MLRDSFGLAIEFYFHVKLCLSSKHPDNVFKVILIHDNYPFVHSLALISLAFNGCVVGHLAGEKQSHQPKVCQKGYVLRSSDIPRQAVYCRLVGTIFPAVKLASVKPAG